MNQADLKRISPYLYEIPKEHRHDMRVPARFYADAEMEKKAVEIAHSRKWMKGSADREALIEIYDSLFASIEARMK